MNANQVFRPDARPTPPKPHDEIGAIYNPAASDDGPAAKLWELLRRNPAFRDDVAWVLRHAKQPRAKKKILDFIASSVADQTSITRPFAGYVLRWLADPLFAEPGRILRMLFGVGVSKIIQKDLGRAVFGHALVEGSVAANPVEFMNYCPLFLLPAPNLYADENWKLWMRLILPSKLKPEYPGPLRLSDGEFSLETPWPQTPRMFRNHFSWLWANYDAKAVNPYTGDRKFLPKPAATGMWGYGLREQSDKLYPRLHNEFIFVVPASFHTEQSIEDVYDSFKTTLSKEFRSLQVSARKYRYLLGGPNQWQAFSFVRDRTTYSPPDGRTPLMLVEVAYNRWGSGTAIAEFERARKRRGDLRSGSKYKGHIESWFNSMEQLMMAIYPGVEFLAVVNLLHPGWPQRSVVDQSGN